MEERKKIRAPVGGFAGLLVLGLPLGLGVGFGFSFGFGPGLALAFTFGFAVRPAFFAVGFAWALRPGLAFGLSPASASSVVTPLDLRVRLGAVAVAAASDEGKKRGELATKVRLATAAAATVGAR